MKLATQLDRSSITDNMPLETLISYQVTIVSNLLSFGDSKRNFDRFGVNRGEWRVISLLGWIGPMTAGQLVDAVRQDKGNISRAIAGLHTKGLVTKLPNRSHKRSPLIWLTEEGQRLTDKIQPVFGEQTRSFTSILSKREKKTLCDLLDKLRSHIERIRGDEGEL